MAGGGSLFQVHARVQSSGTKGSRVGPDFPYRPGFYTNCQWNRFME